ncbi:hypothetical protein L0244_23660 [bacterium]|nr:hypothetical protein [bacterium]
MVKKQQSIGKNNLETSKRVYISQAEIPKLALSEAIRLAQSLYDDFGGKPTAPHQLAMAVDISPTSSNWQYLCSASNAYDLTAGSYKSKEILLTDLGRRIVGTTEEGDDIVAKVEAALRPKIIRQFFERYDRAKFPQNKIARNVLLEMGVPSDRLDNVLEILKRNGEFVGVIHQTKTGPFVAVDTPLSPTENTDSSTTGEGQLDQVSDESSYKEIPVIPNANPLANQRVFITHGKTKKLFLN